MLHHFSQTTSLSEPAVTVPAQREVEVKRLRLEEGRHEAFKQLLVEHAVDAPTVNALAQQRTKSFPRDLHDRHTWTRQNRACLSTNRALS